jgi:uroporphyrinogen decarboxylase
MKFMRVLNGEAVWPPPVWLMRQAGRYLPEYREVRAQAGGMLNLCLNPALATEVTLQPIRRYGFDASILFADILILPMALGQKLTFAEGEGPVLPPITDLATLHPDQAPALYAPILETVRRLRAALPAETALIGFAGAPATVACYMLDGRGDQGRFPRTQSLAYENPALVDGVIDLLVHATTAYLQGQVDAGADCVMIFDTWAGIFPPSQFRRFVIEPTRQIVAALKAATPSLKIIGFPRGCGLMLGAYARETGVDAVALDQHTSPQAAIAACPPGLPLQGNLDPLALRLGGPALAAATREVLAAFRGVPHIFNLGHGITPDVNPAHVADMMQILREA